MKTKFLLIFLFLGLNFQLFSKDKTLVKQLALIYHQDVQMPILMDSTDVNDVKFSTQSFLTSFVPPAVKDYTKFPTLSIGSDSIFSGDKSEKCALSYYEFKIYARRFTKTQLQVASNSDFTVYVNGIKKAGAATTELSLPKGKAKSVDLILVPQYYTIGICCLSTSKVELKSALKIMFSSDNAGIELLPIATPTLKKLSYDDVVNVNFPNNVSISYKGTYLMNKITNTLPGGEKKSWLEVINRVSNTCVLKMSHHLDAAWMPKTEKLYFIEKQAGIRVLKTIHPSTLEEQVLAKNIPDGSVSWSPDESYLLVSVTEKFNDKEKDIKYYILPQDRFAGWRNRTSLYKYDLATGVSQQISFGHQDLSLQDISEDGQKILFRTTENTITKRPFSTSSFYQYNFATNKIDTIWSNQSFISSVNYSPDAKQLLVLGAPAAFNKLGENIGKRIYSNDYDVQAYLYDFASKKLSCLTKNFNPTIEQAYWNSADQHIYFKVYDRDYEHIYRYDVKANNFEMLPLSVDLAQQVDYSGNGLFAVYRGMSASYPSKAYVLNLTTKESTLLSDPEKEKMDQITLGEVQDYNFKSKDGTTIYGRYYLPSDFDKNLKYPMIVYYYGGTTPVQRTFSSNWNFHFWASMGYVVYVVQPSGTIGFGQEFSARHVNAWGEITANDIIQGVNSFCNAHSFVNTKKIGCLGASYGGYMTMYLQTKTNLFATAISHAGISALSSYWGDGYWGYEYSAVATADTYPWNNSKFYTDHSPLFHAQKINTPLLLIQGEVDTNVPVGESMQMFTALKILGKPVSMIRVKNEDHIITEYQHKIDWNYSIMAWMAKYLQDDSAWWENLYPESKK